MHTANAVVAMATGPPEDKGDDAKVILAPYRPPALPSAVRHVALSAKSFRVFGLLNDPAWRNARRWGVGGEREGTRAGAKNDGDNGGQGKRTCSIGDEPKSCAKQPTIGVGSGGSAMAKMTSIKGGLGDTGYSSSSDESVEDEEDNFEIINEDDEDDDDSEEEKEAKDLAMICGAIATALAEDAGGFGTAGFHAVSRRSWRRLSSSPVDSPVRC